MDLSGQPTPFILTSHTYEMFKDNGIEIKSEDTYAINRDRDMEVFVGYIDLLREKISNIAEINKNDNEKEFLKSEYISEDVANHRLNELEKVCDALNTILNYEVGPFDSNCKGLDRTPSVTEWDRVITTTLMTFPEWESFTRGEMDLFSFCSLKREDLYQKIKEEYDSVLESMSHNAENAVEIDEEKNVL